MSDEQVEKIIENLMHTNLYVLNKSSNEIHDYIVGGTDDLKRELLTLFKFNKE